MIYRIRYKSGASWLLLKEKYEIKSEAQISANELRKINDKLKIEVVEVEK